MMLSKLCRALWFQIFAALLIGLVFGGILGTGSEESAIVNAIAPIGKIFMNLIKMMIVPIIFASIVSAISEADDLKELGKIGLKTFSLYLGTTAVAITLAMTLANISGLSLTVTGDAESIAAGSSQAPSVASMLLGLVPANLGQAFLAPNYLQVIFYAITLGVGISAVGSAAEPIRNFFSSFNQVNMWTINAIMRLAPIGVFAIAVRIGAENSLSDIAGLFGLVALMYTGSVLHIFLTYGAILKCMTRHKPLTFFRNILPAQIMAYSTASSAATLPLTIKTAQENVGIRPGTARMTLPLGATLNMDGSAMYIGIVTVVFAAGMGINLAFSDYLWITAVTVLASVGTASVPGASLFMMIMIFEGLGLPATITGFILGIDRINDMARTAVNVTGDLVVCAAVDAHNGPDVAKALPAETPVTSISKS